MRALIATTAAMIASAPIAFTDDAARAATAPVPRTTAEPIRVVEVMVEEPRGGAPLDLGATDGRDCSVTMRWQTSVADIDTDDSKVRVRRLPWVQLGMAWGIRMFPTPPQLQVYAYTDDPANSLYYLTVELNQDCDRQRRYRLRFKGRWGTRFSGIQRDLYFPSSSGWTTETNLDLGYIDLCMGDGHQCDQPYYPGGNTTPFPTNELVYALQPSGSAAAPAAGTGSVSSLNGQTLTGDWVRSSSDNQPNDRMRITYGSGGAVLTFVPSTSSSSWSNGLTLWRNVQSDGSLEVRGSDGRYYPAQITFQGPDEIDLAIQFAGPGIHQTWVRAGPSILGDWERVAAAGQPNNGLRIRVQGTAATVQFLPASATRGLRTGGQVWRNIAPSGNLEVMGDDGRFHPASATLLAPDRLRIDSNDPAADGQIWVRPAMGGGTGGAAGPFP